MPREPLPSREYVDAERMERTADGTFRHRRTYYNIAVPPPSPLQIAGRSWMTFEPDGRAECFFGDLLIRDASYRIDGRLLHVKEGHLGPTTYHLSDDGATLTECVMGGTWRRFGRRPCTPPSLATS